MTKIIGHRGAAGLGFQNSLASFKAAVEHKVDIIEFDLHKTADNYVVILHDTHTGKITNERHIVREKTLSEIQDLELRNGERILTLDEVLDVIGTIPAFIEIKDESVAQLLPEIFARHPKAKPTFIGFNHEEITLARELMPGSAIYVLDHLRPIEVIQHAVALGAQGIGLNMWLMNPLTYWLAKRAKLDFFVYTVNSVWIAKFIHWLYPEVSICTDYPDRMGRFRS